MVVQCKCDAKKCKNAVFFYNSAMRCNANFDSIFASHSHFALFLQFCAFFLHVSNLFGALTVKYRPKRWKKCENAKEVRKVRCECDAKIVRCDEL